MNDLMTFVGLAVVAVGLGCGIAGGIVGGVMLTDMLRAERRAAADAEAAEAVVPQVLIVPRWDAPDIQRTTEGEA